MNPFSFVFLRVRTLQQAMDLSDRSDQVYRELSSPFILILDPLPDEPLIHFPVCFSVYPPEFGKAGRLEYALSISPD